MRDDDLAGLVRGCWETPGDEAPWTVLADRLLELGLEGAYTTVMELVLPRLRKRLAVLCIWEKDDGVFPLRFKYVAGPGIRILDACEQWLKGKDISETRLT